MNFPASVQTLVRRDAFCPVLLLIFTGLIYLPFVAVPGAAPLAEDYDWVMASFEAVRKIIVEYGQFPWWNPWQFGGVPGFADPQMPAQMGIAVNRRSANVHAHMTGIDGFKKLFPVRKCIC